MLKKLYWFLFVYDLNSPPEGTPYKENRSFKQKLMHDITVIMIFSYSLLIFNPLIPIFTDLLAHTFWEKQHLMTVHKFHGKFHVHFELVNAEKQSAKDKSSGNTKIGSEDFTHLIYTIAYNFSNIYFIKITYLPYRPACPIFYADNDYRPPRA